MAHNRYARTVPLPARDDVVSSAQTRPPGLLDRLRERFGHLVHEMGKFGIVGGACYLVDFAVFNICLGVMSALPAKTISTVIAATLAFIGNKLWTWRHREHAKLTRAYSLYFLFNAVGLAVSLLCLWLSHDVLGAHWPEIFRTRLADNVAAMLVGTAFGTAFRFWSYRTFVFVKKADEEALSVVEPSASGSRIA
jgi:putative flippase GtrA